jgi:hypothetical protein
MIGLGLFAGWKIRRGGEPVEEIPIFKKGPSFHAFVTFVKLDRVGDHGMRGGNWIGLAKPFLWLLYDTIMHDALCTGSSQTEPSWNRTLVRTKALPPACAKLRYV